MKKLTTIFAAALTLATSSVLAVNPVPAPKQSVPVLLKNATVHAVVTEPAIQDVLLVDGKIAAMGTNLTAPAGAQIEDLTGKHVYPGLIALINQLGLIEVEAVRATRDDRETSATNPDLQVQVAFNADSAVIPTIRSNGFSHSLIYPDGSLITGRSALMQLDGWNWQDALVQANVGLHVNWPRMGLQTGWWVRDSAEKQQERQREQLEQLQSYFSQAQAYYLAEQAGLNRGRDSRWHAMLALFEGKLPLFVHADDPRQMRQAISLAKQYKVRLVIVGGRDSWRMADELAANNVDVIYTAPYGLPTRTDEAYDQAFSVPGVLQKAGVRFALSLDGFWDTRNLVFAAGHVTRYGLEPAQALRSLTLDAAQIAGVADRLGSIEVGKSASLVVSEGDIFDYRGHNIMQLWIDGRNVDLNNKHKQLHQRYQQRYQAAN
ncbi:amidohydrolase family protein [Alishewanella sp. 16-MA]|uniref:Amidohydrolase family protein n=1 Tax=Alishewanella maricola TaxID=2795740 RepID=A0ABS8C6K4_9ALTE|nr:amidohydrolase family protein [Alishewanella maricola]MCB5227969.1 amidohydrolase family protein [Alishewanella maricola]MDP4946533.1 amidohydrolase family protein [Alishewanella sp.]MDP5037308.1 amidohydrolase family protein [Alishewanella sp.]MDP5187513.1 amidohydrolase family protein [Alishewanella sp.]